MGTIGYGQKGWASGPGATSERGVRKLVPDSECFGPGCSKTSRPGLGVTKRCGVFSPDGPSAPCGVNTGRRLVLGSFPLSYVINEEF